MTWLMRLFFLPLILLEKVIHFFKCWVARRRALKRPKPPRLWREGRCHDMRCKARGLHRCHNLNCTHK